MKSGEEYSTDCPKCESKEGLVSSNGKEQCLFCGYEGEKREGEKKELDRLPVYYTEDEVIQSFQEATTRIGGSHSELSDIEYFKLLLNAKYKKRCQS